MAKKRGGDGGRAVLYPLSKPAMSSSSRTWDVARLIIREQLQLQAPCAIPADMEKKIKRASRFSAAILQPVAYKSAVGKKVIKVEEKAKTS